LVLLIAPLLPLMEQRFKANNAKNKHYNENIIKEKLKYYEAKIEEYINDVLNTADDES
jgi:hypothetical protein